MALTWAKALGWRLQRQLLEPRSDGSVLDVVGRLGAVPAWPDTTVELAVGMRRTRGRVGDAAASLAAGEVVKVYAFRGGTHLMTPQDAGAYLAVRASSRMWELASWQTFYELAPKDWPAFRGYVRDALADGPLTRAELVASLRRSRRYRTVATIIGGGNDTVLKPLTWQGDMGFGPGRDGEPTFVALGSVAGWAGLPDLDDAGRTVVTTYLRVYGPTSRERIHDWFGEGLGGNRRDIDRWLRALEPELATLTIEGDDVLAMADDVDDLRAASASSAVLLLPSRDYWVMAAGSHDARVVPPAHRDVVTRNANFVVHRGAVAGTWKLRRDRLEVDWFPESGRVPRTALEDAVARLTELVARPLTVVVRTD